MPLPPPSTTSYHPPTPLPPTTTLTNLRLDHRHFTYTLHTLRQSYAHFHARLHAQTARLHALDRDRARWPARDYWDMRERIVWQRDDVRKRMLEKREGWGEVMGRLKGIAREMREVRKVVEAEGQGEKGREKKDGEAEEGGKKGAVKKSGEGKQVEE